MAAQQHLNGVTISSHNALKMGHTTDSVIKGKDVIPGRKKEKAIEKIKSCM